MQIAWLTASFAGSLLYTKCVERNKTLLAVLLNNWLVAREIDKRRIEQRSEVPWNVLSLRFYRAHHNNNKKDTSSILIHQMGQRRMWNVKMFSLSFLRNFSRRLSWKYFLRFALIEMLREMKCTRGKACSCCSLKSRKQYSVVVQLSFRSVWLRKWSDENEKL